MGMTIFGALYTVTEICVFFLLLFLLHAECVWRDSTSYFCFHTFACPDHMLWTTEMIFLLANSAESQLSAELKIFVPR